MMANLAKDFEEAAGAPIISAVLSAPYDQRWGSDKPDYVGMVLSWAQARAILDYDYDNGHGGADCHAVYAWTDTRVLFVAEYDGATGVNWIPRNPEPGEPNFDGNG